MGRKLKQNWFKQRVRKQSSYVKLWEWRLCLVGFSVCLCVCVCVCVYGCLVTLAVTILVYVVQRAVAVGETLVPHRRRLHVLSGC